MPFSSSAYLTKQCSKCWLDWFFQKKNSDMDRKEVITLLGTLLKAYCGYFEANDLMVSVKSDYSLKIGGSLMGVHFC